MAIDLSALRLQLILGLILLAVLVSGSVAEDPLRVDGSPATSGCLCIGEPIPSPPNPDLAESLMLRQIAGIAGMLDARDLSKLRRTLGPESELDQDHEIIGTLVLSRGDATSTLSIARLSIGKLALITPGSNLASVIDPSTLAALELDHAMLDGIERIDLREPTRSRADELKHFESPIVLDSKTRRARFKQLYPELTRTLDDERMRVRLPARSEHDGLPGILVWVSPTPNGAIPVIFNHACDELNLIAVGVDNNGNKRSLTDRLQIHLDSITTIQSHYQTDPRRVYITGMSGGGRCSSILQLAFPDIFMGAVPIVGMDSYHRAPTGKPNEYWPERLARPGARWFRLLRERRIAAITGSMDFNEPEMTIRTQQMLDDKLDIRLDVIKGMGHTMPSSEQFADAIRWVDALQQERIQSAARDAQESLDSYISRWGTDPATETVARKLLIKITIDAPWSDAAWEAAGLLGVHE
tara:strand:+ start:237283 stop:238689 length:1407 start_codon:yes stop_codon:yes gene_type:complete